MEGARIVPVADAALEGAVVRAETINALALGHGLAFALDVLGDIELPPGAESQVDQAQIRALSTLYLASDLEPAGVIPAVETLAGLAITGGLSLDLGAAAPLLATFWRDRNERASAAERNAFFSRLFGTSNGPVSADVQPNYAFEDRMLDLCEALYKLDELSTNAVYGGTAQQTRVRATASALLENLADAGGGITAFMAGEIVGTLKEALAILKRPELRGAFMARDVWGVVAAINRYARRPSDAPMSYVRRGTAGMTVISWLADGRGATLVELGNPVIPAAIDWLQASLEIGERMMAQPAPQPGMPGLADSPWAAIGG